MSSEKSRAGEAMAVVNRNVLYSIGIGLVPIPGVDLMGLWAQQLYMLKQLSALYGFKLSDEWGKKTIGVFLGGATPLAVHLKLASLLQIIPVIGHAGALVALPIAAGASTFALGKLFVRHFESGGTLATFNPKKKRAEFERYYKEGKQLAAKQRKQRQTDTPDAATVITQFHEALLSFLKDHDGLHTAQEIAQEINKPKDQVQKALDQLKGEGKVGQWSGAYGTPETAEEMKAIGEAALAYLKNQPGLQTAAEVAKGTGKSADQVQRALDQLKDEQKIDVENGRYGKPDRVQASRDLASRIRNRLAETKSLDTAAELAGALGEPEGKVQTALDQLKSQGEVSDYNGRYGTKAEVDALRELGTAITGHLNSTDGLQSATELAEALGKPEEEVQAALDELKAQGQVGQWDDKYGAPEEVAELTKVGDEILAHLKESGLQSPAELASALNKPAAEVQAALDQLKAHGKVSDWNGRFDLPEEVEAVRALGERILEQLPKTTSLDTASELAEQLGASVKSVQDALDELQNQGSVKNHNGRYGTPDEVAKAKATQAAVRAQISEHGGLQTAEEIAKAIEQPQEEVQQALDQLKKVGEVGELNGGYGPPAEVADLKATTAAALAYLKEHDGLQTAEEVAEGIGKPLDQVQAALNQLLAQGDVVTEHGRYGTPEEVEAWHKTLGEITDQLAKGDGLQTATDIAKATGKSADEVQQALDQLKDENKVDVENGRYGTPDKVQASRDLAERIRKQLAETKSLDTAAELAEALGEPEAKLQTALDHLKSQGEVSDYNGRYGTKAEVDALRELGTAITGHLNSTDGLQSAAEIAEALGKPEEEVQAALDELKAQGQVGQWDDKYGAPEEVAELTQVGDAILAHLKESGLQSPAELAGALNKPAAEVQAALDQLKAHGKVSDWNGRFDLPDEVAGVRALGERILEQLPKTTSLDTASELAKQLGASEKAVQDALDELQNQGSVKNHNGRYGTPAEVAKQIELERPVPVMRFDGLDDCVSIGKHAALKIQQQITIEAWINVSAQKTYAGVLSKVFDSGTTRSGYGLLLNGKSGIIFGLTPASTQQIVYQDVDNVMTLNQWHHVACAWDGRQMRIYVDGEEKAVQSVQANAIHHTPDNDLHIGRYKDDNENHPFTGQLCEVRLWNVARTNEQIRADKDRRLVGNEAGLVGYWPLAEIDENRQTPDLAGNHHGTVHGASPTKAANLRLAARETELQATANDALAYLTQRDGLHTTEEVAKAIGKPVDKTQTALNELKEQGEIDELNGRYGKPERVQESRDLAKRIGERLAETKSLDTVAELAKNLGATEQAVQSALDELNSAGSVKTYNGRYGTPEEVDRQIELDKHSVMQFDGIDDYVELPAMDVDYSRGFTIEAWVQHVSFTNWSRVIDFGNGASVDNIVFAHNGTSGDSNLIVFRGSESKRIEVPSLEIGKWSHMAVSVDASGMASLYKDGKLLKSERIQLPSNMKRKLNYIGRANWTDNGYFHGSMSELRLWKRPRTAAEILADKNKRLTGKEAGLVSCWPLNKVNDVGVTPDLTGKHDGTVRGASIAQDTQLPAIVQIPIVQVMQFDGKDDYVSLPEINFDYSHGFTFEAWVKYERFQSWGRLLEVGNGENGDTFVVSQHKNTDHFSFHVFVNNKMKEIEAPAFELGHWIHIAASVDASGTASLFKDGKLLKSQQIHLPANTTRRKNCIGHSYWPGNTPFFHGSMAELRLWSRPRSAEEIQRDMGKRLSGNEAGLVACWPLKQVDEDGLTPDLTGSFPGTVHGGSITEDDTLPRLATSG